MRAELGGTAALPSSLGSLVGRSQGLTHCSLHRELGAVPWPLCGSVLTAIRGSRSQHQSARGAMCTNGYFHQPVECSRSAWVSQCPTNHLPFFPPPFPSFLSVYSGYFCPFL